MRVALLVVLAVSAFLGGCRYTPTRDLSYIPTDSIEIQKSNELQPNKILVVRSLQEARPPRKYSPEIGHIFKAYIPLVPYFTIPYERLDETDQIIQMQKKLTSPDKEMLFTHTFAEAIAIDLASTGYFKEVRYIGNKPVPADADYVLGGSLTGTPYDTNISSYMLGFVGVLGWIAPIPMQSTDVKVTADLYMINKETGAQFQYDFNGSANRWYTMYGSKGALSSRMTFNTRPYKSNKHGIDTNSAWSFYAASLREATNQLKVELREDLMDDQYYSSMKYRAKNLPEAPGPSLSKNLTGDIKKRLNKIDALRDSGVITHKEHEDIRKRILNEL